MVLLTTNLNTKGPGSHAGAFPVFMAEKRAFRPSQEPLFSLGRSF